MVFDREEIKEYFLPILITDSGDPPMSGVSMLHVIIGDENDNAMMPGHSEILVYNYMVRSLDIPRCFHNVMSNFLSITWKVQVVYWFINYNGFLVFFHVFDFPLCQAQNSRLVSYTLETIRFDLREIDKVNSCDLNLSHKPNKINIRNENPL